MTDDSATLRVEARFKNARLYNAIREHSVCLKAGNRAVALHESGPVKAFCELHGLPHQTVYLLLNLRMGPLIRHKASHPWRIRPICARLATVLGVSVEWLFPADLYKVEWPRLLATEVPHEGVAMSLLNAPRAALLLPPTQYEHVNDQERRVLLLDAVASLTPREQLVVRKRFGLDDGEEQTLEDVGHHLGLQKERVRQLEARALRKLRHPSRTRALRPYHEEE